MNNILATALKYANYLRYLPLLAGLVTFIRTAQEKWKEAGSGPQKLQWVREQFEQLVSLASMTGLIGESFAQALRDGADKLITIIVQGMKDAKALGDAPQEVPNAGPPPAPPVTAGGIVYEQIIETMPSTANLKPGDQVFQYAEEQRWIVRQGGVGIGTPAAPWRLIYTAK